MEIGPEETAVHTCPADHNELKTNPVLLHHLFGSPEQISEMCRWRVNHHITLGRQYPSSTARTRAATRMVSAHPVPYPEEPAGTGYVDDGHAPIPEVIADWISAQQESVIDDAFDHVMPYPQHDTRPLKTFSSAMGHLSKDKTTVVNTPQHFMCQCPEKSLSLFRQMNVWRTVQIWTFD